MRALCASIITAGALIGLGLSAIGVGMRYQNLVTQGQEITYVKWGQIDTPLMLIITTLLVIALIGLGATFLGLAYHHERRHYERHGGLRESPVSKLS